MRQVFTLQERRMVFSTRASVSSGVGRVRNATSSNRKIGVWAEYKLYCTPGSGNSYKIALYLNCAGLDWEPAGVDLAGGKTRDADWRAATNAMGEVPVLEVAGQRMS